MEAQEHWAIPSAADLPHPGTEPGSPALQVDSLPAELPGRCHVIITQQHILFEQMNLLLLKHLVEGTVYLTL